MVGQIDRVRRESLRWQILLVLYHCRENFTRESQILAVIDDSIDNCFMHELRRELSYLESKKLLKIEQKSTACGKVWSAQIEHAGVDFVEYNSDDLTGIARPAKYWE
jgi:hypothetical protein